MAEGVNVRFAGELQRFVLSRSGEGGLYNSASEYIRDLVRKDYERTEAAKWTWLENELRPGMDAPESAFVEWDTISFLKEAKARKNAGQH